MEPRTAAVPLPIKFRLDGEALQRARAAAGISQELLAGLTDVGIDTIRRAEDGVSEPRSSTMYAICRLLDVDWSTLFTEVAA